MGDTIFQSVVRGIVIKIMEEVLAISNDNIQLYTSGFTATMSGGVDEIEIFYITVVCVYYISGHK